MNPHESAAVRDHLAQIGWTSGRDSGDAIGRLPIHARKWSAPDSMIDLEHIEMDCSGNITAAMLAVHRFGTKGSPTYDMIIVYGCAGRNPAVSNRPDVVPGSVVLVEKAQYAENGRVRIQEFSGGLRVECATIKTDRLRMFTIELSSGLTDSICDAMSLPKVSALCTDKVIQIDLENGPTHATVPDGLELSYSQLVRSGQQHIIDMESFGFLWAMGADTNRIAIMRVLTDELADHAQTVTHGSSAPSQQRLLRDNAHLIIQAIETHPRLSGVRLGPRKPASTPSLPTFGLQQALVESFVLWRVGGKERIRAFRELLASASLLRGESPELSFARSDTWLDGLATAGDKGYGTKWLSILTAELIPVIAEILRNSVLARSDQRFEEMKNPLAIDVEIRKFLESLSRYLDPATSKRKYQGALRTSFFNHNRVSFVVEPVKAVNARDSVFEIRRPALGDASVLVRLSPLAESGGVLQWRGFEDDELIAGLVAKFD